MKVAEICIMSVFLLHAAAGAVEEPVVREIQKLYAETGAAIALGQKGEAGGLYCNKLTLNDLSGSWRAVGNYAKTIVFWYSDQPEFAAAAGKKPEAALAKVEVRETAAAASIYSEFFFVDGGLAFFFRSEKAGAGLAGEERIYFKDGKPWLRLLGKEEPREARDATALLSEAAYWQRVFLLSFGDADPAPDLPAGASAKHPVDAWLAACMEKDPSTQGMNRCLGQGYEKWDAELNRAYLELSARLAEGLRPALREAQRAWISYRDLELAWLAKFYGALDGSMYRNMLAADRVELIRKRALELRSLLDVLARE